MVFYMAEGSTDSPADWPELCPVSVGMPVDVSVVESEKIEHGPYITVHMMNANFVCIHFSLVIVVIFKGPFSLLSKKILVILNT